MYSKNTIYLKATHGTAHARTHSASFSVGVFLSF